MMAGVDMLHVPYRGEGPALTDLLAGQVDVLFATITAALELIRGWPGARARGDCRRPLASAARRSDRG